MVVHHWQVTKLSLRMMITKKWLWRKSPYLRSRQQCRHPPFRKPLLPPPLLSQKQRRRLLLHAKRACLHRCCLSLDCQTHQMMQHRPRQRAKTSQSNNVLVAHRAQVKAHRIVTHVRIGAVAALTVTAMIAIAALPKLMMTSRRIARMIVVRRVKQQKAMQAPLARVAVVDVAEISKVCRHRATTVNDPLMRSHCAKM